MLNSLITKNISFKNVEKNAEKNAFETFNAFCDFYNYNFLELSIDGRLTRFKKKVFKNN